MTKIYGNVAVKQGGGVYSCGVFKWSGGVVFGNSALNGGAVYNDGGAVYYFGVRNYVITCMGVVLVVAGVIMIALFFTKRGIHVKKKMSKSFES